MSVGRLGTTAAVTLIMAKFLDPRTYGVMALAMVWVTFAQNLAMHGPAQAVVQRPAVTGRHFDAAFWATLGGAVFLATAFAAAAPFWAKANGTPDLVYVCWAMAPAIVINAFVVIPDAILRRQTQFKRLSVRVLVAGVVSGAAGVAAAVAGFGVWALVIQQLLLTVISAVLVSVIVGWRPRITSIGPALRDIRWFSLHSISESVAYFVSSRSDAIMLGIFFGPVAIGLYRFAIRLTDTVNDLATGGLGQMSLPHLSRYHNDPAAFAKSLSKIVHAGALLALPMFGILAPTAPHLLAFVGPQWTQATWALRALCVAGVSTAFSTVLAPALQAAGRPGTSAALGWVRAATSIAVLVVVGIKFGSSPASIQVFAIAVAFGAIHVVFVVASAVLTFRSVLGVKMGRALLPALPALFSALAAAAAGQCAQVLLGGARPYVGIAVTASIAAAAAGIVLFVCDPEVSSACRRIAHRLLSPSNATALNDGPDPADTAGPRSPENRA